jgi:phenylpropionate dioxygenase-like ring-hydroxylating dioxygenase large terminal subunit
VRVEEWGGFVFVNIDGQAEPLMEYLGPLAKHLDGSWDMARRATTIHIRKELPTNWKAAQEAFLEAYHVMETHSQNLPYAGDANAQYDLFGPNVSRFVHTHGVPSPHIAKALTEQEICDLMHLPKGTMVSEGSTARRTAADHRRKTAGAKWGLELDACTDSEMLDSIEYHLFPNMCIFPGISLPMVYRFRPIDMDPGRTMFDLLFLRPLSPDEDMPEPPEPVDLGPDESYAQVPGLEPWLAATFDQDTENLRRQFRGFTISQKRGETLGNYQESRIRHFHEGIDRYLGAKPA